MICSSCRRTFLSRIGTLRRQHPTPLSSSSIRHYAASAPATSSTEQSAQPQSQPPPEHPKTTDASAPTSDAAPTKPKVIRAPRTLKSSVAGGAELRGLGFTKAKPVIKAMDDHEYPDWLWTLLDGNGKPGEPAVDVSAMTKKQRLRYDKAQERLKAKMPVTIPVHEQSMDLTGPQDDAITSLQRRQEITKSARTANRQNIRETNFLKSM